MKFNKILLLGVKESVLEKPYLDKIKSLSKSYLALNPDAPQLSHELPSVDCLLVHANVPVDEDFINKTSSLKYIGKFSTAYGNINLDYATKKKICVCNIPGYSRESVAEFAIAVILEYLRDLERGKSQARDGNYSELSFTNVSEIKSKKFGVLGLGSIGSRVAELAQGFGADVTYWSRNRKKDAEARGIKYQILDKLLRESDFISLHLAVAPETKNFLSKKRLALIKKGAVLVNLAPNDLIDLEALEKRLAQGDITYIFDHTDELKPGEAKSLSKYKNCIMYPPIAYVSKEALKTKQEIFVSNVENFVKGHPQNKVN